MCALAGPRRGDAVAAVGAPALALRALLAATGTDAAAAADARVVLTGDSDDDVREGLRLLIPGGRMVGVAADAEVAVGRLRRLGLRVRHLEQVGERVAWSAECPERGPSATSPASGNRERGSVPGP